MGTGKIKPAQVVIDTNVVVSAILFGGTPGKLIPLWKTGQMRAYISKEILDEYMRVFAYPRFNLSEKEIEYLIYQEILPFFHVIEVRPGPLIIKQDPSDDHFIRCAESSGSNIIISGDQHLISLKNYGKIKIISPSEFLKSKI